MSGETDVGGLKFPTIRRVGAEHYTEHDFEMERIGREQSAATYKKRVEQLESYGITLRVGGDPDVYVITHNRVEVIIKFRTARGQTVDELIRMNPNDLVASTFKAVFAEAMHPYGVSDTAARKWGKQMGVS